MRSVQLESSVYRYLWTSHKCLQVRNDEWQHRMKMVMHNLFDGSSLGSRQIKAVTNDLELAGVVLLRHKAKGIIIVDPWSNNCRNHFVIIMKQVRIKEGAATKDLRADWNVR